MHRAHGLTVLGILAALVTLPALAADDEPGAGSLTLADAVALVEQHPLLAGRRAAVAAARARSDVAGLGTPWEVTGNVSNFGILGDPDGFAINETAQGFEVAEFSVELGRTLELGGKPGARRRVADVETQVAEAALAADTFALRSGVRAAYWDGVAARQRVALAGEFVAAAEQFTAVADRRVAAGAASAAEAESARAIAARRRSELATAVASATAADTALGAALGVDGPRRPRLSQLPDPSPGQDLPADLGAAVATAPVLAAAELGVSFGEASLAVAELAARPDVRVGAGVRYLMEFQAPAFVAGVTVPIGTAARAAPGAAAARADREVAAANATRVRQQLVAQARALELDARTAAARFQVIADEIAPRSRAAVELLERGYGLGRFSFVELAAARQAVIDAEGERIAAALAYQQALAGLEAIVGPLAGTVGAAD